MPFSANTDNDGTKGGWQEEYHHDVIAQLTKNVYLLPRRQHPLGGLHRPVFVISSFITA